MNNTEELRIRRELARARGESEREAAQREAEEREAKERWMADPYTKHLASKKASGCLLLIADLIKASQGSTDANVRQSVTRLTTAMAEARELGATECHFRL